MKKLYFDETENNKCIGIFMTDVEIISAGTTIYAMPITDKNYQYQEIAHHYDIHFIFEDNIPMIPFYTVPQIDIMATDSNGGFIGTLGHLSDLSSQSPICYIDINRQCYLIAPNGPAFLQNLSHWKNNLVPYNDVLFYDSKASAQKALDFITLQDINNKISPY